MYESNKNGGREIEDKEGNIQMERGLKNNREIERESNKGREREGIEKQVAKLKERGYQYIYIHTWKCNWQ